jgi:hypothetical protein
MSFNATEQFIKTITCQENTGAASRTAASSSRTGEQNAKEK